MDQIILLITNFLGANVQVGSSQLANLGLLLGLF
jgi:hypothetical protein